MRRELQKKIVDESKIIALAIGKSRQASFGLGYSTSLE